MAENIVGTYQGAERRPYVKPFVRNLDASETEGKTDVNPTEFSLDGVLGAPS